MYLKWHKYKRRFDLLEEQLLIENAAPELDLSTLPVVVSSMAEAEQKECEPAGTNYHQWCLMKVGLIKAHEEEEAVKSGKSDLSEDAKKRAEWEKNHKHRFDGAPAEKNYYEALEIGHIGVNATEAQIKKAYQKMLLKYHPDKLANETGVEEAENDPRFLGVQRAWETLGTPARRRGYDSQFDFDEKIPSGLETLETDEDFFKLYGPVFERNARFSKKKPVPLLGDSDTDIKKVQQFYQFWGKFDSWREFSHADEHSPDDIETAESREERRYLIRQNEAARSKKKRKEYERLHNLYERARKNDFRLIRHNNAIKEKKEADKRAKIEAREAKIAAEKKAIEDAKLAKEQAAKEKKDAESAARKAKQNQKKAFKKQVKKMDKALEAAYKLLQVDLKEREQVDGDAHEISQDITRIALIKRVVAAFDGMDPESNSEDSLKAARNGVDAVAKAKNGELTEDAPKETPKAESPQETLQENVEENNKPAATKDTKATEPEWTATEMSLLAKAVSKFPGGTRQRWEQIESYMLSNLKEGEVFERTKEAYIAKTKAMSEEPNREPEEVWNTEQQKQLEAALAKFPSTMDKNERWNSIAEAVENKTKSQCVARFKHLRETVLAKKTEA